MITAEEMQDIRDALSAEDFGMTWFHEGFVDCTGPNGEEATFKVVLGTETIWLVEV